MTLTADNYFSPEASQHYMGVSQYKEFAGCYAYGGCEAKAMARLNGEYAEGGSDALLVGSYVDAYFEGTLDAFKDGHPEIFLRNGNLKADYAKANEIIARIERDELFMKYMSGQKQVIMTGEISGIPWKIKMDSYIEGKAIVDLKIMASLTDKKFVPEVGKLEFVRYWGYDVQGAAYQEIVYQNTGKYLPFFIAGASKEKATDIEVIHVHDSRLVKAMMGVERNIERVAMVKSGAEAPTRCEACDHCRNTKVLKKPISILDLGRSVYE
jgi:hypothetical protein